MIIKIGHNNFTVQHCDHKTVAYTNIVVFMVSTLFLSIFPGFNKHKIDFKQLFYNLGEPVASVFHCIIIVANLDYHQAISIEKILMETVGAGTSELYALSTLNNFNSTVVSFCIEIM